MDRINGANTVNIGSGRRGFRGQNKESGLAGTELAAAWFNAIQEEMLAVIEGAGIVPSANDWTQLKEAIEQMIAAALPEADLSPYLQKSGGTLVEGGHISDTENPTDPDHLVRKGYVDNLVSTAIAALTRFGVGQTWQGVTRVSGTAYQNTTTRPIMVAAIIYNNGQAEVSADGSTWVGLYNMYVNNNTYMSSFSFVVPVGWYYRLTTAFGAAELR